MTKQRNRKAVRGTLDRWFSLYIRRRDSKKVYSFGEMIRMGSCRTCWKIQDIRKMNAGHFMSRRHENTRWDERNVHLQCVECNKHKQGLKWEMGQHIDRTYGKGTAQTLEAKAHIHPKLYVFEMLELIEHFKKKAKALE